MQLNYNARHDHDEWKEFDVFVHPVPEGYVGRAIAEGLREGWPDHHEGWTCIAKSDSWTSPFLALKDLWYQIRRLKIGHETSELPDPGRNPSGTRSVDASGNACIDV